MKQAPSLLLLGGGYTLSQLAHQLPPNSFVITSTSETKVRAFHDSGYLAERVSLDDSTTIAALFAKYDSVQTIVDSTPPLRSGNPTSATESLISQFPKSVRRVFYLSTTGVYGKRDGSWVTEDTACTPYYESSALRVQVEKCYWKQSHFQTTAFRLSGIYGPERGVGLSMKNGTYRLIENDTRFTNRIHVADIVGILSSAITSSLPLPNALNVSDDCPALATEVTKYYQEHFSCPPPQQIAATEAEKLGGRMVLNQRVSNSLVKDTLSYIFRYPTYREGAGTEFVAASNYSGRE